MREKNSQIRENGRKGFSMIELIIVIAIMAILVALIATQLFPYLERSKATRDYNALDTLFESYSTVIAEADDPTAVTLNDPELLKLTGKKSIADFESSLKSKQLNGTSIKCFCSTDGSGQIILYGICAKGMNGYTGVQVDSSAVNCQLGQKGNAEMYINKEGASVPLAVQ